MHQLQTLADLEAVVGKPPALAMMKQIAYLDEGCLRLLAHSPVAGFGYLTLSGKSHTTLVGGSPGFVGVDSPTQIAFDFPQISRPPSPNVGLRSRFYYRGWGRSCGSMASFRT